MIRNESSDPHCKSIFYFLHCRFSSVGHEKERQPCENFTRRGKGGAFLFMGQLIFTMMPKAGLFDTNNSNIVITHLCGCFFHTQSFPFSSHHPALG